MFFLILFRLGESFGGSLVGHQVSFHVIQSSCHLCHVIVLKIVFGACHIFVICNSWLCQIIFCYKSGFYALRGCRVFSLWVLNYLSTLGLGSGCDKSSMKCIYIYKIYITIKLMIELHCIVLGSKIEGKVKKGNGRENKGN